jgi:feruloyl-CoA synthase
VSVNCSKRNPYTGYVAPAVNVDREVDGCMRLSSSQRLTPYVRCVGGWLEHWGRETPDRVFLAERRSDGTWCRLAYGAALSQVRAIAQGLLERGLSDRRPVAVLSDNSINHALLALAAMHVGVPVAPISTAYSLVSEDYSKLRAILAQIQPGLIYVDDEMKFARALAAVDLGGADLLAETGFSGLARPHGPEADRATRRVGPDSVAKILFTSGSTGAPKGVINTQRMLCANQQSIAQVWRFRAELPPVLVDWLPWSHTFGGNHNFNMVLRNGGTLYLDAGKPQPGLMEETVANLREVAPTMYFNVPRGFYMLIEHLERDPTLRANFFSRLEMIFYAAASLPQDIWHRFDALAKSERSGGVAMLSGWGATETAPVCTNVHFPVNRAGVVGLPLPGVELKMVPTGDKFELRVRGPNVTPGYFGDAEATCRAFDEQGYYRTGDVGRLVDSEDPSKGIELDGRLAEDFKLMSGAWVRVGALRVRAIEALSPVAQDVVISGHGYDEIGLLIFPNIANCRELVPHLPVDAPLGTLLAEPLIVARVREGMGRLAQAKGTSLFPTRALFMEELPSVDAGEITDKGYINQGATLVRRAELVHRMHLRPTAEVIVFNHY